MALPKRVDDFVKRFADLCLGDPTFGEVPYEFIRAAADPDLAPAMMAVARVFLLDRKDDVVGEEEMAGIMESLLRSFHLEWVRRTFASDRPRTFALRDARIGDFLRVGEFEFDEDEAIHSMRLKIQGLLGIELSVEKTREIMRSAIEDATRFYDDGGQG